ncbi:MAG: hypothetical protein V1894_04930 [Chloroflexota bacterium]
MVNVRIEVESNDYTGYSVSVPSAVTTGQCGNESVEAVQGMPVTISRKDLTTELDIFPEAREERFLDEKLIQFYKKKGYSTENK